MAITRSSHHKRRATGGRRHPHQKKRKFSSGRPTSATKLGAKRIHLVRTRGGNTKYRALRLQTGNFSWGGEAVTKPTRIVGVVYNSSNNELVRTNTLVKNAVVEIDSTPFVAWYEKHYRVALPKKDEAIDTVTKLPVGQLVAIKEGEKKGEFELKAGKISSHLERTIAARQADRVVDPKLLDQMRKGRVLAVISSRPGQSGRADGYILEGPELDFYLRKLEQKKKGEGK